MLTSRPINVCKLWTDDNWAKSYESLKGKQAKEEGKKEKSHSTPEHETVSDPVPVAQTQAIFPVEALEKPPEQLGLTPPTNASSVRPNDDAALSSLVPPPPPLKPAPIKGT